MHYVTENPATSREDAADLLGAVDKAQSKASFWLRVRVPELCVLAVAQAIGTHIGQDNKSGSDASLVIGVLGALVVGAMYLPRRRNLGGGTIAPSVWIVAAAVIAGTVASNLAVHGSAELVGAGLCLAAGVLVLAAVERSWVLAIVGVVQLPAAFVGNSGSHGDLVISAVVGVGCTVILLVAASRRHPERKQA